MKIRRKEQKTIAGNKNPDYVGYKHPPVKYRWQKGQTGNPHGRPKKDESFRAIAERELKKRSFSNRKWPHPASFLESGPR